MSLDHGSTAATTPVAEPRPQHPGARHVAIVGCGPSGCYTALALRRSLPDVHVTIFDVRPTPFGLLRYGVAPDHQGMKNVSRQFDRLFGAENVRFVGNVRVGQDLPFATLEEHFDAVVVATGLAVDRPLAAPIDAGASVVGAGQLLRLLNGDPDSVLRGTTPSQLGSEVLIVGTGNVAMDVARLLCKSDEGFEGSDVDDDARQALATNAIEHLVLLSRGPKERVRWDASMFAELCALPGVTVYLDGELELRSAATDRPDAGRSVRVDVRFREIPTAIATDGQRTIVRTRFNDDPAAPQPDRSGEAFTHHVDTVVTAMGFIDAPSGFDQTLNDRVVKVGGCESGALGNLAENRALAKIAAQQVISLLKQTTDARDGWHGIEQELPDSAITFDDWTRIDRAEIERARPGRVRRKFTAWSDMTDHIARST
ncbi:FAD-dependent oxidoreductase [Rhodococcus sp. BP-252]|uniref:FAD-dependent oxidoreductase n=1 Tax=unclassified Rhodococcus (in: high G+C Gram-positive bacteria) TaxID=192944 RepID=UPI001C9B66C4|nr:MULTISPECIES: FAD-dependent oxidoreductase [unclassified Rhodococcus (in: high G+C Gram-positive bacteria)]MBY6414408.1 FAD-dependent oxidoreductase [Rhodococcus sp. BP-320]MBY6419783.1 FAD-dependent oxidoreductase [Rhodococcus sp. BP-321]MBY6424740.1 FAD-dependent oxidoreductase [Rhodococcus sp. BP-324]MBY6429225.1 FAD-dependent oxidoreductase [Rhodococcus sp. BP-323]MBY6434184.1 FAD-dependent oxidoreductase [Rhodococcus sp. BP-322]